MSAPTPIVSVRPVPISVPHREADLQVRVTAPATGTGLPVIVFAHGFGWSMDGYAPLVDHWASHGFVVVQPTFLDSRRFGIPMDDPRSARIWRLRIEDVRSTIDALDDVLAALPGLLRRADPGLLAVAGHSWGGQTVSTLLGACVLGPGGDPAEDFTDARVRAGILLATTGLGDSLTPFAAEHLPFMRPGFDHLATPTLVVAGDQDRSPLSTRGPDWFTDVYRLSPGATHLLTVDGGEHSLGGIAGHEVAETTDESPERVALVQQVTTAYLRQVLLGDDGLATGPHLAGSLESKADVPSAR